MRSAIWNIGSLASAALAAALAWACATSPRPASIGTLQGAAFDFDGRPVSGATLELEGQSLDLCVASDSQGRFSFADVKSGAYTLAFSKPMYETRSWQLEVGDFMDVLYVRAAGYWQLLDEALASLGRREWAEAEEALGRARAIQAEGAVALFLEAALEERRGKASAAIGDIEAALRLDPRSPYLWLYLADLYERSGDEAERVAEALDRYLAIKDDPVAASRLGSMRKQIDGAGRRPP